MSGLSAVESNPVAAAMAGDLPELVNAEMIEMRDTARHLRAAGCSEQVVRETLEDAPTTQAIHDQAVRWHERHMRDPDWTKRLLPGDGAAGFEHLLWSIVLTQPIKDSSA